jgi:phosphoribosylformylglycinamidine synthase
MKVGIVVFPGSNCDHDAYHVVKHVLGQEAHFLWHKDHDLKGVQAVILPGGFSYGDYLRCGAMARFSPVMEEVVRFARSGGPVLGICNGFQILTEAGLLPGALLQNLSQTYLCQDVHLKVENSASLLTRGVKAKGPFRVPIAHGEGNFFLDDEGLKRLEGEGQVVFRYVENPNGSCNDIAGIQNEKGNVLGLMPHPERACEAILGNSDGLELMRAFLQA